MISTSELRAEHPFAGQNTQPLSIGEINPECTSSGIFEAFWFYTFYNIYLHCIPLKCKQKQHFSNIIGVR